MPVITTQEALRDFCGALSACEYITVDTEFLRDKTYYPILCLVQMAGPGVDARAIDPIDTDLDWTPVYDILNNKKILKIFHAARQDIEIFYHMTGQIPAPIFDTQVAAMVCGYGDAISYHALVKDITEISLEKSAQFTDWSRRPLAEKQISYALDDVIHLLDVYTHLQKQLNKRRRAPWLEEEMKILTSKSTYDNAPEDAWRRIRIRTDKRKVLAILQAVAAWREEEAKQRDVPRNRVLKDETLVDIALYGPEKQESLMRIRNFPNDLVRGKIGREILKCVKEASQSPKEDWPKLKKSFVLPKDDNATLEMLRVLLRINCIEADVSAKLVASKEDLQRLADNPKADVPAQQGWRYTVFGKDAKKMMKGKLALTLHDKDIKKITL